MTTKYGPYTFPGVVDVGRLMDMIQRDVAAAKAKSWDDASRALQWVKQGHADWLSGHSLAGRALRRAGSPFSHAYDDLEKWLAENRPAKAPRPTAGFVYVIGMEDDPTAVKIGFAVDVEQRLMQLQISSHHTLKVLALTKGTMATEKETHCRFATDYIRGEWFRRSAQIEEFISKNKA
jgi:hypothetical protein